MCFGRLALSLELVFGKHLVTTSSIGRLKSQLDTPTLCIDLDLMESNIRRMSDFIRQHGMNWRPHAKCHKTPAVALRQIAAGAIGGTCAKVSEAEGFAAAGGPLPPDVHRH